MLIVPSMIPRGLQSNTGEIKLVAMINQQHVRFSTDYLLSNVAPFDTISRSDYENPNKPNKTGMGGWAK